MMERLSLFVVLVFASVSFSFPSSSFSSTNGSQERNQPFPPPIIERIIGGSYVNQRDYPYIVAIRHKDMTHAFCGGSIIAKHWLVTAAHCFDDIKVKVSDFEVVFGSTGLEYHEYGSIYPISKVIVHQGYNPLTLMSPYDIALVRVPGNLIRSNRFWRSEAIALNRNMSNIKPGIMASVSGYGLSQADAEYTETKLKATKIPIQNSSHCEREYDGSEDEALFNFKIEICAGFLEGGDDTCQGDSGGPLVVETDTGRVLAGITSGGRGCGENAPARYTNVAVFVDWIEGTMRRIG